VLLALLSSAPARALSAPTPWDGVKPFNCTIQDAGQGTTVPDPGADPYCVRFDKTSQNVAELGANPSLTMSALTERCAERLVDRGADFGLPAKPAGCRRRVPPEHVRPRVVPSGG
jgi:hypothetical protein